MVKVGRAGPVGWLDRVKRAARAGRLVLAPLLSMLLIAPAAFAIQTAPPGQSEYVPIKDLPPTDQMPAAPLLITAYAFVWLAVLFYLWTIWRRLAKVEAEMNSLAQKTSRR
jgi:CcmD family protein